MNNNTTTDSGSRKSGSCYRASCDNCARSKVRCTKERPSCQRCIQQDAACVYSPSQRSGRRTNTALSSQSHKPPAVQQVLTPFTPLDMFDADLDSLRQWNTALLTPPNAGPNDFPMGIDNLQPLPWPSGASDHHEEFDQKTLAGDEPISICDDAFLSSLASPAMLEQQTQGSDHRCSKMALDTLRALGIGSTECNPQMATTDNTAQRNQPRSLDTVLQVNHTAINTTRAIVSCSCAANTNVALLITITVFKILSWFDASLQQGCGSNGARKFGADSSHEMTATEPSGESVTVPPISIGTYQLDMSHRCSMIAQMVSTELASMHQLMDAFSDKFCQHLAAKEDSGYQLQSSLEMFMRHRLKATMDIAKEQLVSQHKM